MLSITIDGEYDKTSHYRCHKVAMSSYKMLVLFFSSFTKLNSFDRFWLNHQMYEGHLESKERFAIKKYLLIIGKKKNMQVLSHTFTYFCT